MAFLRSIIKNGAGNKFVCVNLNGNTVKFGRASITTVKKEITATQDLNTTQQQKDELDIRFEDTIAAFKSKTTWELIRAYLVYTICSSNYIVENNQKVSYRFYHISFHSQSTFLSHSVIKTLFDN